MVCRKTGGDDDEIPGWPDTHTLKQSPYIGLKLEILS
jgi:hypothetical protein